MDNFTLTYRIGNNGAEQTKGFETRKAAIEWRNRQEARAHSQFQFLGFTRNK